MLSLFSLSRRWLAKKVAVFFHYLCDPVLEAELATPAEFDRIQEKRRRKLEAVVAKYLGVRP